MKVTNHKTLNLLAIAILGFLTTVLVSCTDNSVGSQIDNRGIPEIEGVRYVNPDSSRNFTQIGPRAVIALLGNNIDATNHVYFNGIEAPFNPALMTDSTLIITVPSDMPFGSLDPESETMNTIKVSNDKGESTLDFNVVPPAPQITNLSNEYAAPGQQITVNGQYLYLITGVQFPGDIQASDYVPSPNGTTLTVTVPEGATQEGEIRITSTGGSAKTPTGYGYRSSTGIISNFDDVNTYIWGASAVTSETDIFPGANGAYARVTGSDIGSWDWAWYNGTRSVNLSLSTVIDPSDLNEPVANFALKFEIYVKSSIENGLLLIREDDSWQYTYRYEPWDKKSGSFSTDGWQTVTVPLTEFRTKADGSDGTGDSAPSLSALTDDSGQSALGFMFVNDSEFAIPELDMAVDNIRVVRIAY